MTFTKTKMMTMLSMLVLFFSFCVLFSSSANGQGPQTAYQVLQDYNLPTGLLPQTVIGHSLNRTDGQFLVNINGGCHIYAAGFQVKYDPTMTAVISKDRLSYIHGVKVKLLFWTRIMSVARFDDEIELRGRFWARWYKVNDFISSAECNKLIRGKLD
ncbi:uncharacterized protein At5g01610-like [Rutidosis leptorrhynchoides]|uniref:uncharacterized protein At5g01610-like n=1 Tax=Rutidosis leptorrhynchoides TaxID=125765 RepID=UPI003A9950C5